MRKLFLVLLAVLMAASACAGDDDSTGAATVPAQPVEPAEPELADPEPVATIETQADYLPVGDRPVYDPAGDAADAAVYLHALVVWTLETTGDPAPDELAAASRQASECYASSFVSVLDQGRLTVVAADLSGQDLQYGLPVDVVTVTERDRLFVSAAPCLDQLFDTVAFATPGIDDFFPGGVAVDAVTQESLEAGFAGCLTTIVADDDNSAWLLETALFDSPAAEQKLAAALLSSCSGFMASALTEGFVSEGYDRDVAECVAPPFVEMLEASPGLVAGIDGDTAPDPAVSEAMLTEMFAILADCDALGGEFFE